MGNQMNQLTTIKTPEIINQDIEDILTHIEFRYLEYNMYFDEDDLEHYDKVRRVLNWLNNGELNEIINDN